MQYIQWTFIDSTHRSFRWYSIGASLSLGIMIWAIMTSQYFLAIIIAILASLVIYTGTNTEEIQVQIQEKGVYIGNLLLAYNAIQSFGFIEKKESEYLRIFTTQTSLPYYDVPLVDTDKNQVQALLETYVPFNAHMKKNSVDRFSDIFHL